MVWDFAVKGVPVSAQSTNKQRKRRWTSAVRSRAATLVGEEFPLNCPVAVGVTYFYDADVWISKPSERLDVDNQLKPILDGLYPELVVDDELIRDVSGSRRPLDPSLRFVNPSDALVEALGWQEPFVYVRIGLPIAEETILWIGV